MTTIDTRFPLEDLGDSIAASLRAKQGELGLDVGGANLWPVTAAQVAVEVIRESLCFNHIDYCTVCLESLGGAG